MNRIFRWLAQLLSMFSLFALFPVIAWAQEGGNLLGSFFTGGVLDWVLATPVGRGLVAAAISIITLATSLQLILRGLKSLTRLTTKTEWDDLRVGRAQVAVDRVLIAARAVATVDPDMLKRIAEVWKPIPRAHALNFDGTELRQERQAPLRE